MHGGLIWVFSALICSVLFFTTQSNDSSTGVSHAARAAQPDASPGVCPFSPYTLFVTIPNVPNDQERQDIVFDAALKMVDHRVSRLELEGLVVARGEATQNSDGTIIIGLNLNPKLAQIEAIEPTLTTRTLLQLVDATDVTPLALTAVARGTVTPIELTSTPLIANEDVAYAGATFVPTQTILRLILSSDAQRRLAILLATPTLEDGGDRTVVLALDHELISAAPLDSADAPIDLDITSLFAAGGPVAEDARALAVEVRLPESLSATSIPVSSC